MFALQDEITERVATTIGEMYGVITRVELQRVRSRNTTNLESCECLPHAYEYQRLLTPDEHYFARDRLEDVVENDPDYADAWAVPAWIYADVHWGAFDSVPDPLDRALHAATQAVKLAPMHQQARLALANVHFFRKDLEAFPIAADETLAMSPNDSNVLATIGIRYAYAEQREKGVALVRKAMEINPGHPGWYYFAIAFDRYRDGDYGGGLSAKRRTYGYRVSGTCRCGWPRPLANSGERGMHKPRWTTSCRCTRHFPRTRARNSANGW